MTENQNQNFQNNPPINPQNPISTDNNPPVNASQKPPQKQPPKKSSSASKILFLGMLLIGLLLIVIFYGLLLWGLLSGDVSNPIFATLGINEGELQQVLMWMTNGIFGFFALIFLVSTLAKLFQGIMGKKGMGKSNFIKAGLYFGFFIFLCGAWLTLYWFIDNANVQQTVTRNDSLIVTKPANVIGLTAPIKIEFDLETNIYHQIDRKLIRQINWDFDGDGTIDASGPLVTHRFLNKGSQLGRFPVTANVYYISPTDGKEKIFTTQKEVIISNEAVVAVITSNYEKGPMPLNVEFSAESSYDPDGEVIYYEWDLNGDGDFEIIGDHEVKAEKLFSQMGEYEVKLRVTGTNNDFDVAKKVIEVTGPEEDLKAEITASTELEGIAPLKIILDGSQSFVKFGKIVRYEWQVEGEDEVVVGRKLQRTFREPGQYKVSLIVENDMGKRSKTTETINVLEAPKNIKIDIQTTPESNKNDIVEGTVPFEVVFNASQAEQKDIIEWQWDFEDDGLIDAYEKAAKHIFRKPGEYEVRLTIIDIDGKKYEQTQKVHVKRTGIQARINAKPSSGSIPLTVLFDGSGSKTDDGTIIDYIWEFPGEDPIHYNAQISREFRQVGVFPVRLTVLTSTGKTDTTQTMISVRSKALKAEIEATPTAGEAPLSVTFDPSQSAGTIFEYEWHFGDGQSSREYRPTHIYQKPGEYKAELIVKNAKGMVSSTNVLISVR